MRTRKKNQEEPREATVKVRVADLDRIETKIDRLLFLLGEGRGRTTAELGREADAIIIRLQNRQARKEARKKGMDSQKKGGGEDNGPRPRRRKGNP